MTRHELLRWGRNALIALVCGLFLLPPIWAVSTALRPTGEPLPRQMEWIPSPIAWENVRTVFELVDATRFVRNSLFVASLAVPITILVASLAGFALSQISGQWRRRLVALSAACLMVPLTAIWIPRFLLFEEVGLIDHRSALVVPSLMGTSPFFVLLFLWSFSSIPREVYDAARLDGAGAYRIWAGIGLPQIPGAVGTVAVLAFVHYWNSFVEPLLLMRTADNFTVSLGLRVLYSLESTNWPIIMSGAILATLPVLVVFVVAQRAFLRDSRLIGR